MRANLLRQGIEFYKKAQFREAVESVQSVLKRINNPKERAQAHLYLGFSKWGLADTKSSVIAEFREALRYNPSVQLPLDVGQNHPVFKPMLEKTRKESTGTLTINATPPETEIQIYGGEIKRKSLGAGTVTLRLFKGIYAIEGVLEGAHKVVPVLIKPGHRQGISFTMPKITVPEHEFELSLDLFSAEQPKEVIVHYTIYDANGDQLEQDTRQMQLREKKSESSIWVYHVKLPSATQGAKIVYRIEADGKVIRDDPIKVQILEPLKDASFYASQTIPIKARVMSNIAVDKVRVYYDSPSTLADSSPSRALVRESPSNAYTGEIPVERNRSDGKTGYFVAATTVEGNRAKSLDRVVHDQTQSPVSPDPIVPPDDRPLKVREPAIRMYQGVWASHSWSNVVSNDRFVSDWERGGVVSVGYLSEGKGFQTLGAQLDYPYENSDYTSAMVQWGPAIKESPIAFAFLAGAAGYRSSVSSSSGTNQSAKITPLVGGSLKFYPLENVSLDLTTSIKLRSDSGAEKEYLHHYEMGIRLYISPTLNLKAGYGRWQLAEYDNTSVQIGFGATF